MPSHKPCLPIFLYRPIRTSIDALSLPLRNWQYIVALPGLLHLFHILENCYPAVPITLSRLPREPGDRTTNYIKCLNFQCRMQFGFFFFLSLFFTWVAPISLTYAQNELKLHVSAVATDERERERGGREGEMKRERELESELSILGKNIYHCS